MLRSAHWLAYERCKLLIASLVVLEIPIVVCRTLPGSIFGKLPYHDGSREGHSGALLNLQQYAFIYDSIYLMH